MDSFEFCLCHYLDSLLNPSEPHFLHLQSTANDLYLSVGGLEEIMYGAQDLISDTPSFSASISSLVPSTHLAGLASC